MFCCQGLGKPTSELQKNPWAGNSLNGKGRDVKAKLALTGAKEITCVVCEIASAACVLSAFFLKRRKNKNGKRQIQTGVNIKSLPIRIKIFLYRFRVLWLSHELD